MDGSTGLMRSRAQMAMILALLGAWGLWWIASANLAEVGFGARLAVGVAVLVGASLMGLRALGTPGRTVAGEAWLVLAAFAQVGVGATLAQAFNLGGDGWELWAAWAVGTGAMAWAVRSGALGLVTAVALLGLACTLPQGWGWTAVWGFALGLVPLAYLADSRAVLQAGLVGTALTMLGLAGDGGTWYGMAAVVLVAWVSWDAWHHARLPDLALRRELVARDPRPFDDDLTRVADQPFWAAGLAAAALLLATTIEAFDPGPFRLAATWPTIATAGIALIAATAAWLWADGRATSRVLHRAVGVAAGALILLGSGGMDVLGGEAARYALGMSALAGLGAATAYEARGAGQAGFTALGLGAVVLLAVMVLADEDAGEVIRAASFVMLVGAIVLTRWWSGRAGDVRPAAQVVTKGVER